MTTYTLIAYREDGADYCRGCLMGSSSSDFGMEFTESLSHLQTMYAEYLKKDIDDEDSQEVMLWDLTILRDGKDLYDDHDVYNAVVEGARSVAKAYKEAKALRLAEDKFLKQQQAAERKRQSDLAELARLSAVYNV